MFQTFSQYCYYQMCIKTLQQSVILAWHVLLEHFQISHISIFTSTPVLCRIVGIMQHYFWLTCFLVMSLVSLDFFYRFSNIYEPWFVKKRQDGKVKYCWIIGGLLISIPVCLDEFTDWPLAYASNSGICFIEPQTYLIAFFISPSTFLVLSKYGVICGDHH